MNPTDALLHNRGDTGDIILEPSEIDRDHARDALEHTVTPSSIMIRKALTTNAMVFRSSVLVLVLAAIACGPQDPEEGNAPPGDRPACESDCPNPPEGDVNEEKRLLDDCREVGQTRGEPASIQATVDLINALPRPVSIPCVMAALPRPLHLVATTSVLSAQPALGHQSPRLFILMNGLSISIVPPPPLDWMSSREPHSHKVIEFGEWVDAENTVKGELAFPVEDNLGGDAPYEDLRFNDRRTVCSFCHANEGLHATTSTISYRSLALRPLPRTLLSLDDVLQQAESCDEDQEPERCHFFQALTEYGDILQGAFDESLPVFGG